MNPNVFSLRKLFCYAAFACCSTFALMGPVSAATTPDGYVTDSLVGQSKAQTADSDGVPSDEDSKLRRQASLDAYRDAHGPADKFARTEPFIRDALIGQVPEAPSGSAVRGDRVAPEESSDLSDEIILAGALVLALLMGSAITLSVGLIRERTA